MKKTLPVALGVVVGLYAVIQYYVPHHAVGTVTDELRDWAAILSAAAYLLGAINLIQVTLPKIRRREPDWQFKVVMLLSAGVMLIVGLPWGKVAGGGPGGQVVIEGRDEAAAAAGKAVLRFEADADVLVQAGTAAPVPSRDPFGRPAEIQVEPGPLVFKAFREVAGYGEFDTDAYARAYAAAHEAELAPVRAELAAATTAGDAAAITRLSERLAALSTPPPLAAGQVAVITADPPMQWGSSGRIFVWIYDHVFAPCNATMFALLAFFVASAAFRAFRARNVEAALLLVAAILIMIGNMPMGRWLWEDFPDIKQWILDVPNNGSRRAIIMGAAVGAISTSLRVVLGLERSHLGSD
ncbi:MAG: hypothetical protein R2939_07340 [Kofleriaceae bacterium]